MKKSTCPHCGREYSINNLHFHTRSCRKRPSDEELKRLFFDGYPEDKLGQILGVTRYTIHKWLDEAGLLGQTRTIRRRKRRCNNPETFTFIQDHVFPLAEPSNELAPRWGYGGGCAYCGHEDECRRRVELLDLWPLCQVPTRLDVALAFIDGRIGFDGHLPEWLPGVVEELTP